MSACECERAPCVHDATGWAVPMGGAFQAECSEDDSTPCTCTRACIPQGLGEGQACRLTLD